VATSDRSGLALSERLLRESHRFEFFQLVQLLLREQADAVPPGGTGPALRENIRFRPSASLGFAASDVEGVKLTEPPDPAIPERFLVTVNFMGLYGPASPMPNHFTEDILWAGIEGDGARDFLDVFHHRIISFLYRAWEKYRHPVQFDPEPSDPFTRRMLCLMGLGTAGIAEGAGVELHPMLRTAGLLAARQRSAAGLEGFLRVHFDENRLRVEACLERRVRIPRALLMRLGQSGSRLGEDACLGEVVRDRSGAFRVVIGPLTLERFRRFLPSGEDLGRLVRLVRLYVSDPLDLKVVLRLQGREIPPFRLSPADDLPLGQLSWLAPPGREEGRVQIAIHHQEPPGRRSAPPPAPAKSRTPASAGRPAAGATASRRT
jgi:type VI secretion system protein ImpH